MFRKIFITVFTTLIMVITGTKGMQDLHTDNSDKENMVVEEVQEEIQEGIIDNSTIENNESITKRENYPESVEVNVIENKEKNNNSNVKSSDKQKVVTKKAESNVTAKQETKVESKETKEISSEVKTNIQKKDEIIKKEDTNENTKETIDYNASESQRMVNDIKLIAKQNEFLWDSSGNPLFKVEISKSALNGEYMYPYSKERLEGKVLNVFPVKFLVYVVDVQKPGFQKEMKYYISIVNL